MENFDSKLMGRIHSFETMGALDGPGIRVVIFMQGCMLKCKYCQNRDTWDINRGQIYTVKEIVEKVSKYENYINESNGGITVSGGEPLLQAGFLINLFKELKKKNIHTAIDTSGMVEINSEIRELIELTDLFLLDIKSINDNVCKYLTGKSNIRNLEFAKYLSDNNKEMWIRQVLVPTITNKKEDLIKLKEFINSLKSVKKIEILPYHSLGKFKWDNLGKEYEFENIKVPTEKEIREAKEILKI